MAELGGPGDPTRLPAVHRRRVADPWWFRTAPADGDLPAGTIGIGTASSRPYGRPQRVPTPNLIVRMRAPIRNVSGTQTVADRVKNPPA
jgi:hypothetical protein